MIGRDVLAVTCPTCKALEKLIKAHTEATTIATISATTERIAEEMAREVLSDPAFRAELKRLVRVHFSGAMEQLAGNGSRRRKKRDAR